VGCGSDGDRDERTVKACEETAHANENANANADACAHININMPFPCNLHYHACSLLCGSNM